LIEKEHVKAMTSSQAMYAEDVLKGEDAVYPELDAWRLSDADDKHSQ